MWISYGGFPVDYLWLPCGLPMDSTGVPKAFSIDGFHRVSIRIPYGLHMDAMLNPSGFPLDSQWIPCRFLLDALQIPNGIP